MQRVFFNRDLLPECLLPFLSLFDVFHLFASSSEFSKTYKRKYDLSKDASATLHMFNQRLLQALTRYFANQQVAEQIHQLLQSGKLFLTGGFLLAVIQGDDPLQCSNVDLGFVLARPYNATWRFDTAYAVRMHEILQTIGQVGFSGNNNAFTKLVMATAAYQTAERKPFQLSCLDHPAHMSLSDSIGTYCAWFDLSVCANYYTADKLVCLDLEAVRLKMETVKFNEASDLSHLENLKRMIAKYQDRGYFFQIVPEHVKKPKFVELKWASGKVEKVPGNFSWLDEKRMRWNKFWKI